MLSTASVYFLFKSKDVPGQIAHPLSTKYRKTIERTARERATESKKEEVMWNVHNNWMPNSFLGPIQICSDKTETSLK